jgi:hypothetical protein
MANEKRYNFFEVFKLNSDGSLTPARPIQLGGVRLGPGVAFSRGVVFSGTDIFQFYGRDISAVEENGVLIIMGYY